MQYAIEKIEIYNMLGENIYSALAANSRPDSDRECTVDCRNFLPGIYLVKIIAGENIFFKKVIKE
jgi:hypothetical protein